MVVVIAFPDRGYRDHAGPWGGYLGGAGGPGGADPDHNDVAGLADTALANSPRCFAR